MEDETELVQYGQSDEISFEKLRLNNPEPSDRVKWPTRDSPTDQYKFNSVWLELGQNLIVVERSTYSLLEWLGDVGGLFDGLKLVTNPFIGLFAAYSLQNNLISLAFRNTDLV